MARRRSNPATTALVVTGAALLLGAAAAYAVGSKRAKNPSKKRKPNPARNRSRTKVSTRGCDPSPYAYREDVVQQLIDHHLATGEFDKAYIAQDVAYRLYGHHPEAGMVSFPPRPHAPRGVDCVWGLVTLMVDRRVPSSHRARNTERLDLRWVLHKEEDPGYPWEEPTLHLYRQPMPSSFVDTAEIGGIDDLTLRALGSGLMMAGLDPALAAANNSTAKRLRRELRHEITSCEFNDTLYGQLDVEKAGGNQERGVTYMMSAEGRGLNWLPVHSNNLARMARGLSPRRSTDLWGEPVEAGSDAMVLWVPAIDLEALRRPAPTIQLLSWSDGTNTSHPPPQLQALGLDTAGIELEAAGA